MIAHHLINRNRMAPLLPTEGPTYKPHLLSRSGHSASLLGFVKVPVRLHGGQFERLPLADGGTLTLHWWAEARVPRRTTKPVVLILHGINNSSSTPYIQYIMRHLEQTGFESVCLNMRGHGKGNPIRSARQEPIVAGRGESSHERGEWLGIRSGCRGRTGRR